MMNQLWLALEGGFHVLLAGMVLGAGLPLIFSLGIRALSYGVGGDADIVGEPLPVLPVDAGARVVAYLCFAIVILAILYGIAVIVSHGLGIDLYVPGDLI